ncbi:MAG: SRPBCC family protein, partial [Nocardioides sp.]
STTIGATPAVVFGIVANPHQHPRIDGSGSVQSLVEGPDLLQNGTEFHVSMKLSDLPYTITNRVVELEPDRRIAWRHFGGHRWRCELEPSDDGGTRVKEKFDYTRYSPRWRRVIELLGFPDRNRRGIEETLVRLKGAAEQDQATRPEAQR